MCGQGRFSNILQSNRGNALQHRSTGQKNQSTVYLPERTTVSKQEISKGNAMEAQDEDFYETKIVDYNVHKADAEKVLH